jgi:hypothetical protein
MAFLVLSLLGAWICLLNWSVFWRLHVRRQPSGSWIPILGALLMAIGFAFAPWPTLTRLWWLPFLCDWGSLPGLVHTAVVLARHRSG